MKTSLGKPWAVLAGLLAVVLVTACSDRYVGGESTFRKQDGGVSDSDIIANSYQATERLLRGSHQPLDKDRPILVASLVNVANLQLSSNLGRIISEQISSRLTQLGYQTREMKFRGSFLIKQGAGEFVLSRALRDISQRQEAQAVVTGVYAVAKRRIFVTLRLIRAEDSTVIASYDYALPLGPDTLALLGTQDSLDY